MHDAVAPKLSKWPFFAADLLLLAGAYGVYSGSALPLGSWQLALGSVLVFAAAAAGITPFVLEYQATVKLAEARCLAGAAPQFQQLAELTTRVTDATARWQTAQDAADKTSGAAKQIAEQMNAQVEGFKEFMERMNESEKGTLRVEVEKLRRSEADWLQVAVRTLDHVYALHTGAVRSGQTNLINQLGNFQNACRDLPKRLGLLAFVAGPGEPFDRDRHQLLDGEAVPADEAKVGETIAAGYTYQGRLLRPALVRLTKGQVPAQPAAPA